MTSSRVALLVVVAVVMLLLSGCNFFEGNDDDTAGNNGGTNELLANTDEGNSLPKREATATPSSAGEVVELRVYEHDDPRSPVHTDKIHGFEGMFRKDPAESLNLQTSVKVCAESVAFEFDPLRLKLVLENHYWSSSPTIAHHPETAEPATLPVGTCRRVEIEFARTQSSGPMCLLYVDLETAIPVAGEACKEP